MKKEISIRTISDDGLWDSLVATSPQGTVFSRSAWLCAVAEMQAARPVRLGAWYNGELAAGISFVEVSRGGFRKALCPMLTPYGGLLYAKKAVGGDTTDTSSNLVLMAEQLIARLEHRYHQVTLSHGPGLFDVRPFAWKDWETQVRYTYQLDITDRDNALKQFKNRVRGKIKRIARDVTVKRTTDTAIAGELHEQAFRRQGAHPPFSGKQFAALLDQLLKHNLVDVLVATDQKGATAGVQVNGLGNGTVYTLFYGASDEYRQSGVDSFLIHEAVGRYSPSYHTLDLLGANIPSIAFYKRGFGGKLIPYYVTQRYSSAFARGVFAAYTRLRKFVRR